MGNNISKMAKTSEFKVESGLNHSQGAIKPYVDSKVGRASNLDNNYSMHSQSFIVTNNQRESGTDILSIGVKQPNYFASQNSSS